MHDVTWNTLSPRYLVFWLGRRTAYQGLLPYLDLYDLPADNRLDLDVVTLLLLLLLRSLLRTTLRVMRDILGVAYITLPDRLVLHRGALDQ